MTTEFRIPGGPRAPLSARAKLSEQAPGAMRPVIDDMRLLVSELVTNCVVHGGAEGDGQPITVRASLQNDHVLGEVCHAGPAFVPPPGENDLEEPGGLGLILVEQLSRSWGIARNGDTCVWFELELAG